MKVKVTAAVTQSLLTYYKALRTNPKYNITWRRAWEKYSNFYNYVYGGIVNDFQMGRYCPYFDLGQRFGSNEQPQFPYLRYITYVDKSNYKWYISYYYDEKNDCLNVVRIKGVSNVKCESKVSVTINEYQLRRIIRESIKKVLNII